MTPPKPGPAAAAAPGPQPNPAPLVGNLMTKELRTARDELAAALALLSHADKGDAGNQVRLMSMHASKGLEFRFVFIVGVEDGNLPHEASIEEGRIDEERRLFYVGITRAKERLWLSHAKEAQRWGDKLRLRPSRFLDELPAEELQRDGADPEAEAAQRAERRRASFADIQAMLAD